MLLSLSSIKNSIDGTDYQLNDTDVIYLDVKKNAADRAAVIRKKATAADLINGTLPFVIYPEDTAELSAGDYWFDVRLVIDDKNIYTIIPMSKLHIVRNVTDIPESGGADNGIS